MTKLTRYSEAFWGKKFDSTDGYDVLITRMKDGKRFMKDVLDFLKQRAKLEEDYYNGLHKLCKGADPFITQGSLQDAWVLLKQRTQQIADEHGQMCKQVQDSGSRITEFINQHNTIIKQEEAKMKECQREKHGLYKKTHETRRNYETKCTEREQLAKQEQQVKFSQDNGMTPKDANRIFEKYARSKTDAQKADEVYKADVESLERARKRWEAEMTSACDIFQKLDEERIDFLRNELWVHTNVISQSCVDVDKHCEEVRKKLEGCSIENDILTFINSKSTGVEHPDPIPYQPFVGASAPARQPPVNRTHPSGAATISHAAYNPHHQPPPGHHHPPTRGRQLPFAAPQPQQRPGMQYSWTPKN